MEVQINTLTPLWTGGVDSGKVDRIHETGILGSLRWWTEVLVRGVGGQVKDPTSDDRSSLDLKKFDAKAYRQMQDEVKRRQYLCNAGLCDVSQIFGATGWKHRFRLEVQDVQVFDAPIQHPIKANRTYTDDSGKQKTPTWYFPDPTKKEVKPQPPNTPKIGTFTIKIQSLHPNFKPEVMGGLIQFIADWSVLGARPQMGFGVIQVMDDNFSKSIRLDPHPLYDWLKEVKGECKYPELPSLQNIFLAQIQPKDSNTSFTEKDTFNLKYDLRQCFRANKEANKSKGKHKDLILRADKDKDKNKKKDKDEDLRHCIMGTNERIAAKVKVSRPYENDKLMRVWGWIPEEADIYKNGWNREKVVDVIYQYLIANYTLHIWREMNSTRDAVTPNKADAQAFLRSLLQLQEGGDAV